LPTKHGLPNVSVPRTGLFLLGHDESGEVVLALGDALALGLALAEADGDALALALAEADGEALALAAETILAEVFAVLVALALGPGLAGELGLADEEGLGLAEGVALADGVVVLVTPEGWYSSTWRNMSRAVVLTSWIVCWEPLPGTVTTRRLVPCGWTWAPELPVPLTRDSMTETAAFISSLDGAFPLSVWAWRVTWVPLDRSRPSPTLNRCCHWDGLNNCGPRMPSSMTTMSTSRSRSARPGCGTVLVGAATCPPVLNQP